MNKKFHIGVDALAVSYDSAGSFTVLLGLMREFCRICDYTFTIYAVREDVERELGTLEGRIRYVYAPSATRSFARRILWQQFEFPHWIRRDGCDLVYSASGYPLVWSPVPVVSHQQNLWSFARPEAWWTKQSRRKAFLRRQVARLAIRTSAANLYISEYMRQCGDTMVPGAKGKNYTIPNAISEMDENAETGIGKEWTEGDFCLSVSSFFIQKNYLNQVEGFYLARRTIPSLRMIMIGINNTPYGEEVKSCIRKFHLEDAILLPGRKPLERIYPLYKKAVFSLNLSLLEGFGLSVLESMSAGCPVICSDIPAFHEIGEDAAAYCDSKDPAKIAETIAAVCRDPRRQEEMRKRGLERSRLFTWRSSAEKVLSIFQSLLVPSSKSA